MNKNTNITNTDLGYDEFFESERKKLGLVDYPLARVVAEYKEAYRVRGESGEYLAKITGKQMFHAAKREDYPAVGDWVAITELDAERAVIHAVLPRRTMLKKKYSNKQETQLIAANIDTAFITEAMDRDYSLNRLERYYVLVEEGKINPVFILNKIDLISETELGSRIAQIKNRFHGIDIILTSVITRQGLEALKNYITSGKTYCFLGSSGVGKSSLINKLLGKDEIKTREISLSLERGRHTTTTRELYLLENGGLVIDNPGTREVGIGNSDTGIENVFEEIQILAQNCKYTDCSHTQEPGCAVIEAVEETTLDTDKYMNYMKLKKESEFYKMNEIERRIKDRKFGQYIKKIKDKLKDD